MELLAQNILNGVTIGTFYALVALGYTMVYGVLKLINFAHGDLFMWGAYLGYTGFTLLLGLGLRGGPWMIVPVTLGAMLVVALGGVLLERTAYRPLRHAGPPAADHLGPGRGVHPGKPGTQHLRRHLHHLPGGHRADRPDRR